MIFHSWQSGGIFPNLITLFTFTAQYFPKAKFGQKFDFGYIQSSNFGTKTNRKNIQMSVTKSLIFCIKKLDSLTILETFVNSKQPVRNKIWLNSKQGITQF